MKHHGLINKRSIASSCVSLFILASISGQVLWISVSILCITYICRYREKIRQWFWKQSSLMKYIGIFVGSCTLLFIALIGFFSLMGTFKRDIPRFSGQVVQRSEALYGGRGMVEQKDQGIEKQKIVASKAPKMVEAKTDDKQDDAYLGIPVAQPIPNSGRSIWLNEVSIPESSKISLRLLIVSPLFSLVLGFLLLFLWIAPLYYNRQTLFQTIVKR